MNIVSNIRKEYGNERFPTILHKIHFDDGSTASVKFVHYADGESSIHIQVHAVPGKVSTSTANWTSKKLPDKASIIIDTGDVERLKLIEVAIPTVKLFRLFEEYGGSYQQFLDKAVKTAGKKKAGEITRCTLVIGKWTAYSGDKRVCAAQVIAGGET